MEGRLTYIILSHIILSHLNSVEALSSVSTEIFYSSREILSNIDSHDMITIDQNLWDNLEVTAVRLK